MSMNPKPRKRYTADFKARAVGLLEIGRPITELAEELCISANHLYDNTHRIHSSLGHRTLDHFESKLNSSN